MIRKLVNKYKSDIGLYNNIIGTALVKCASLIINIYSLSVFAKYFQSDYDIYGVWLTIVSILSWVVSFDLGIGNGLRNRLVKYLADGDRVEQKTCISSAYLLISIVSVLIAIAFCTLAAFLDWNEILKIEKSVITNNTLMLSVQIAFVGLILQFILKLVISILYAMKKTTIGSLVALSSNIMILLYALVFRSQGSEQGLINISCIYAIFNILPLLVTSMYVFWGPLRKAKPSFKFYNHRYAVDIMSLGGRFFGIQLLLLLINSTNSLIITQVSGPSSVVEYNMYFRIYSAIIALFSVIINPVWSSVSESFHKGDYLGIRKRKIIIERTALILSVFTFLLIPIMQPLLKLFYGNEATEMNISYVLVFSIFTSIMLLMNSKTCISNGINDLGPQIKGNLVAAILKFPLIFIFMYFISSKWIIVVVSDSFIMLISLIIQHLALKKRMALFTSEKIVESRK